MNFREHKKKDLFKFIVNNLEYPGLLAQDLHSIRTMLGDFEVVRVKQLWPSMRGMKIWVEKK